MRSVPVLLISGAVGVGKTSTALAISDILRDLELPHAVVDLDALSWTFPRPPHDRFHQALALRNLAALWVSYRAAGAERLIIARVVESREELAVYRAAVPGAETAVVRLRASTDTLRERVAHRERDQFTDRSLERSFELAAALDRACAEDYVVETDGRSLMEVARAVLEVVGWPVPAEH